MTLLATAPCCRPLRGISRPLRHLLLHKVYKDSALAPDHRIRSSDADGWDLVADFDAASLGGKTPSKVSGNTFVERNCTGPFGGRRAAARARRPMLPALESVGEAPSPSQFRCSDIVECIE